MKAEPIPEIFVRDAADVLKRGAARLLDVRTEEEYALARIEGALLLTEKTAPAVMGWPKDTPLIVHCHHGVRSFHAAAYLREQGFTDVRSLAGGIDAWSREIDPRVPLY
jgi:rhodanese-related sulfurtransferase